MEWAKRQITWLQGQQGFGPDERQWNSTDRLPSWTLPMALCPEWTLVRHYDMSFVSGNGDDWLSLSLSSTNTELNWNIEDKEGRKNEGKLRVSMEQKPLLSGRKTFALMFYSIHLFSCIFYFYRCWLLWGLWTLVFLNFERSTSFYNGLNYTFWKIL